MSNYEKFISYLKENDFVLKSSGVYDGISKSWDLGRNGVEVKNKIKKLWWKYFVSFFYYFFGAYTP